MEEFEQQGGISFIIVHYTALDEMYYVPFTDVKKFWDRMEAGGRKSFTYDEIDKNWKYVLMGICMSITGTIIH